LRSFIKAGSSSTIHNLDRINLALHSNNKKIHSFTCIVQILMVMVKFEEDNDGKLFVVIVQKVDNDIKSKNLKILCAHMELSLHLILIYTTTKIVAT
jgi:hypothetical protein